MVGHQIMPRANPQRETILNMEGARIKFGAGATRELGFELRALGVKRALLVTDPVMATLEPVAVALASLRAAGIDAVVHDQTRVEPSDASFKDAIQTAVAGRFDGFAAVGGGSSIDTAKAANLYSTYPAEFLTYVNPPIGRGLPVPGALKPLVAVPTTAGTGSETTGVAIFDLLELGAKTGIAHRALRPSLGIVDPDNTRTLPPVAIASTGLDVLSHAIESFTALPYTAREAPSDPALRPAYQGANPISDLWARRAIELVAQFLVPAMRDPADEKARSAMLLAATCAGYGFGNAGVHLPHGMSYPVSSLVASGAASGSGDADRTTGGAGSGSGGGDRSPDSPAPMKGTGYHPAGYPDDHPLVPHGMSVILNAPAVFRFTGTADPERHLEAARLMGADVRGRSGGDQAGAALADAIVDLMRAVDMPSGLAAVGLTRAHIPALVAGTLPQHRVTKLSPRPAAEADLAALFADALRYW